MINNSTYTSVPTIGNMSASSKMLLVVPLYHSSGCAGGTMTMITNGCELVMPAPHFDPVMALKAMETKQVGVIIGVPTMFLGNDR